MYLGFAFSLHYPPVSWLLHKANGEVSSQRAATLVLNKAVQTWIRASMGERQGSLR